MARRAWWAKRWLDVVEQTALDPLPLRHGRALARRGAVGRPVVEAGRAIAHVNDDGDTFVAGWTLPMLRDEEWQQAQSLLFGNNAYWAALLGGELHRGLAVDAEHASAPLLPSAAGLEPHCSCDDFEVPCRHAAAVAVALADALAADPFLLFAWRGRDRQQVVRAEAATRARALLVASAPS